MKLSRGKMWIMPFELIFNVMCTQRPAIKRSPLNSLVEQTTLMTIKSIISLSECPSKRTKMPLTLVVIKKCYIFLYLRRMECLDDERDWNGHFVIYFTSTFNATSQTYFLSSLRKEFALYKPLTYGWNRQLMSHWQSALRNSIIV